MNGSRIHYNPKLKQLARQLRNNSTLGEILLWEILKGNQLRGCNFHRQKPIGNYIADFYCHKLKLVIEIDGVTHDFKTSQDIIRQKNLESLGLHALRFTESEVRYQLEGVVSAIKEWIEKHQPQETHPSSAELRAPLDRGENPSPL